jgi:hypothetical protein
MSHGGESKRSQVVEDHSLWQGARSRDDAGVVATLSDDVVLHSPAVIETHYSGRALVARIVRFAMRTIEDVSVTDQLHGGGESHALIIEGHIGTQPLQGCLYLHADDGGLVDELTLMLRPFHAMQAFVTAMGAVGAQPALDLESGTR